LASKFARQVQNVCASTPGWYISSIAKGCGFPFFGAFITSHLLSLIEIMTLNNQNHGLNIVEFLPFEV
jgi:hypothetical protein